MSSSNNRFGRRTGRQSDEPRFEPVLSFDPKRRAAQRDAASTVNPKLQAGPHVDREDAEEFGISFGDEQRIERDDFDPRTRREKALEQRDTASEQMLYHHLFDEQANRRRGFGWVAALASVAIVAIGGGYAWHNFMSRPVPGNLLQPPGFASRGNNTGYTTPQQQPTTSADTGSGIGSPAPLAATPPAPSDQQPTKDIAAAPEPKSAPAEPPPPPRKTISEAAANPGNLNAPANPAPAQIATPSPSLTTPPPKRETAKSDTPKPETPRKEAALTPPRPAPAPAPDTAQIATPSPSLMTPPQRETAKSDTPKPETPRKEASLTPPRPAPASAPQNTVRQNTAPPPAVTEPASAPAVTTPPSRRHRPQATGQPQALTRNAPADYAPPQQQYSRQQPQQPDNIGPPPGTPDTVTVDGVTYVNGQEPRSLGTLAGPTQAASTDTAMSPSSPAMPASAPAMPAMASPPPPPAYTSRPYIPTDHAGGAPLPNEVIILPNGQMAVPNGPQ